MRNQRPSENLIMTVLHCCIFCLGKIIISIKQIYSTLIINCLHFHGTKMWLELVHDRASFHLGIVSGIMTFNGRKGRKVGIARRHNDLMIFLDV